MVQPAEPAASPTFGNDDDSNKKNTTVMPKGQSIYLDGSAAARQLLMSIRKYCTTMTFLKFKMAGTQLLSLSRDDRSSSSVEFQFQFQFQLL
jgi:hypothetical protein